MTALLDANLDSVPLVAITGQVGASLIGTDAFQEADIIGATYPLVKHSFLVTDANEIPARIAEAYHIARSGRPGPVLVDVTKSAQIDECEFSWPPEMDLPGYNPPTRPSLRDVSAAARMIAQAAKPVFYVGGGAIRSRAHRELAELVEATGIPVVTTLNARGAFPDSDPHHLGMPGMHGTVPAVAALQKSISSLLSAPDSTTASPASWTNLPPRRKLFTRISTRRSSGRTARSTSHSWAICARRSLP